jgi:hypothetical protein
MTMCSHTKYINVRRALMGFGDSKDLAFNELLENIGVRHLEIGCAAACRHG